MQSNNDPTSTTSTTSTTTPSLITSHRKEFNTDKYCKGKKLNFLDFPINRAEYHYTRADTLLKNGKNTTLELERICIELTRSCSLKPKEVKNFLGLAECFRRACDSSSAIFSLRFALQLHPNSTYVKIQLGELLINRAQELMKLERNYNKASRYFEEALKLDSSRDNIWLLRCVCEVNCKEFEKALYCINRTINLSTNDSIDSYILRAKIHWAMGNMDIGNKDLRKAMVIDKDHPEVKAFIRRSFEDARRLYNESIEHFQAGNSAEAIKCCENALIINGEDVKLYLMLSKMHRQKGDLNEAFRYLKDAEKQFHKGDPYNVHPNMKLPFEIARQQNLVINEMAMKEAMDGDCEKAIVLLNKAIATERRINDDPQSIPYIYFMNRGDCYRALQEPLFAIADYKLALERSPDNWDITTKLSMSHYLLAVDYFNDSKYLSCYEQIDGAIRLNGKVPEYYALRGKTAYFQGMYHEAYLDFKKALEKNPNDAEILKFMRQFEAPPEKEKDNNNNLFVGVRPRGELDTRNVTDAHQKAIASEKKIGKVKLKPSTVPIVNDPLGVNSDYERLASWNTLPTGEQKDLDAPIQVSKSTSLLPTVNPYLAASVVYHDAAKSRMSELSNTLHSRTSVEESNLWTLIREAENRGRAQRKPKNEKNAGLTESEILAKKTCKIPPSSTGLKRRSQERSKEAMKNPLVAGVVTTYNDPLLVAERAKRKMKQQTGISRNNSSGDLSTMSAADRRAKAINSLSVPTSSYTHHKDPDEKHKNALSVSDKAAQDAKLGRKPYMVTKRERTLTEFLMAKPSFEDGAGFDGKMESFAE